MKKLLTVFLILALVMSFFVACDGDSAGGGGGGVTPKKPTEEQVEFVQDLTQDTFVVTFVAFNAAESSSTDLNKIINDALEAFHSDYRCDEKSQKFDEDCVFDLCFHSLDDSVHFSIKGSIVFDENDDVSSVKFDSFFGEVSVSSDEKIKVTGSGTVNVVSEPESVAIKFDSVKIDGDDYVSSDFGFSLFSPDNDVKDIVNELTNKATSLTRIAYQGETINGINSILKTDYVKDNITFCLELICSEVTSVDKEGPVRIVLDLSSSEKEFSVTGVAEGSIDPDSYGDTDLEFIFSVFVDKDVIGGYGTDITLEAIGRYTYDHDGDNGGPAVTYTYNKVILNGDRYVPIDFIPLN